MALQSSILATSTAPEGHLCSNWATLDKCAIVAFAARFDPQPYHLDADAAEQSIFGGLCASGWHVAALATRLVSETLLHNGLPFVEMTSVSHLTWNRPSFVNEKISVRIALGPALANSAITGTYNQTLEVDVCNDNGTVVATMSAIAAIETGPADVAEP